MSVLYSGNIIATLSKQFEIPSATFEVPEVPTDLVFFTNSTAEITIPVKNTSIVQGKCEVRLKSQELVDEVKTVWLNPDEVQNITYTFNIPDDYVKGDYIATVTLQDKVYDIKYIIEGVKIDVTASLDKEMYEVGEIAKLTLNIKNTSLISPVSLFARATIMDYDNVINFTLVDEQTIQFDIPVKSYKPLFFAMQPRIFYGIYQQSGRSVYLNSIYLKIKQPDINLYTDKQVYNIGEVATCFIKSATPGNLRVYTIGGFEQEFNFTEQTSTSFTFTIPPLSAGTYSINYYFNDVYNVYNFDVAGYNVKITEVILNKTSYNPTDTISLTMRLDSSHNILSNIKGWIWTPDGEFVEVFDKDKNLTVGANRFDTTFNLNSNTTGLHRIIYAIYSKVPEIFLSSGSEAFDVSGAALLSLTTDKSEYTTEEDVICKIAAYGTMPAQLNIKVNNRLVSTEQITFAKYQELQRNIGKFSLGDYVLSAELISTATSKKEATFRVIDNIPPTRITDLAAIQGAGLEVNLIWSPATDNVGIERYVLYRYHEEITEDNKVFAKIIDAYILPNVITYTDTTTEAGQTYYYAILAVDKAGNFAPVSNSPYVVVAQPDTTPPTQIGDLRGEIRDNYIELNWSPASDNIGLHNYILYRYSVEINPSNIEFATIVSSNILPDATSYIDTQIDTQTDQGKRYYYVIVAVDTSGNKSQLSNNATILIPDITPPEKIIDLRLELRENYVQLNWSMPSDNVGVSHYRIYRYQQEITEENKSLATIIADNIPYSQTNYTDTTGEQGKTYYYAVTSFDTSDNESLVSNSVNITIPVPVQIRNVHLYNKTRGGASDIRINEEFKLTAEATGVLTNLQGIIFNADVPFGDDAVILSFNMIETTPNYYEYTGILTANKDIAGRTASRISASALVQDVTPPVFASEVLNIMVDTQPPQISELKITGGILRERKYYINSSAPEITAILSDDLSGIDITTVKVVGNNIDWQIQYNEETKELKATPPAALAEGEYIGTVEVKDKIGNLAAQTINFVIDITAPVIVEQTPEKDSYINNNQPLISIILRDEISDIDIETIVLKLDGEIVGYSHRRHSIEVYYQVSEDKPLKDGLHNVYISAKDFAGNTIQHNFNFTVDTTLPIITITIPDKSTDGEPGEFTWKVEDVNLKDVIVKLDGEQISTNASGNISIPNSLGEHKLEITANDLAGNTKVESKIVTVVDDDATPPIITLTGSIGEEKDNLTQSFIWNITDESGLEDVLIIITKNEEIIYTSADISGTFNFDSLGLGNYKINVSATDQDKDRADDQLSSIAERQVTVTDDDTTAPEITITYQGENKDGAPGKWTIPLSDPESEATGAYTIDNNTSVSIAEGITTVSVPNTLGEHTIIVFATNNDNDWTADEETTTKSDTQIIVDDDVTPPTITDVSIKSSNVKPDYAKDGDIITITAKAIDLESGIDNVYAEVDQLTNWSIVQMINIGQDTYQAQIIVDTNKDNGIKQVKIYAINADKDREGDQEKAGPEVATINIDNTAPVTNLTPSAPLYNNLYAPITTTYTLSAEDPLINDVASGIARVEYKVDEGNWTTYTSPITLTEGIHKIEYRSIDNIGNLGDTKTQILYVDATPPVTTLNIGEPKYEAFDKIYISNRTPLTFTCVDPAEKDVSSGFSKIEYRIDRGDWILYTTPFTLQHGIRTLEYRGKDNVDNEETIKSITLSVDAIPPSRIEDLTATASISPNIELKWSPASDNVGVSYYNIYRREHIGGGRREEVLFEDNFDAGILDENKWMIVKQEGINIEVRNNRLEIWGSTSPPPEGEPVAVIASKPDIATSQPITFLLSHSFAGANEVTMGIFGEMSMQPSPQPPIGPLFFTSNNTAYVLAFIPHMQEPTPLATKPIEKGSIHNYQITYNAGRITWSIDGEELYTMEGLSLDTTKVLVGILIMGPAEAQIEMVTFDNIKVVRGISAEPKFTQIAQLFHPMTIYIDSGGIPGKTYDYAVNAVDILGNVSEISNIATATVKLPDTTPPVTTIIPSVPFYQNKYAPMTTTYTLTAEDPVIEGYASGIDKTEYRIDEGNWTTYTSPITLTEGIHKIEYRSTDNVGNIEDTKTFTVYVDATAPITTIDIREPKYQTDKIYISPNTPITIASQDPITNNVSSGVKEKYYRIDEGMWKQATNQFTLQEGMRTIEYYSVDNVGNTETTKTTTLYVDATPPVTELSIDGGCKIDDKVIITSQIPITLTATDPVIKEVSSGVKEIRYRFQNGEWRIENKDTTTFTIPANMSDGEITIEYYAVDNVSNNEEVKTITVILDNTPPTLEIYSPQNQTIINNKIAIIGKVEDVHFGASYYSISYGEGENPSEWIEITKQYKQVTCNITDNTCEPLTYWDTKNLTSGIYTIKLTSSDCLNNTKEVKITVKVGEPEFTLSWGEKSKGKKPNDGEFNEPYGLAAIIEQDSNNKILVTDKQNHRIQIFNETGEFIAKFGEKGNNFGEFQHPTYLTVDKEGNIYIADTLNHRIQVFDKNYNFKFTFGQKGEALGEFNEPIGVALDKDGYIYITDKQNNRIQKFTKEGTPIFEIKEIKVNEEETITFTHPEAIAVDNDYNIYVSDTGNDRIIKFTQEGNLLLIIDAENETKAPTSYGNHPIKQPLGIRIDQYNNLYVADQMNHRIQKFDRWGYRLLNFGTKGKEKGEFNQVADILLLKNYIYVTDIYNHRVQKFSISIYPELPQGPKVKAQKEQIQPLTLQNVYPYPNPYMGSKTEGVKQEKLKYTSSGIKFKYNATGNIQKVTIEIYNIKGKLIDKFYDYTIDGEATYDFADRLANGVYIYRITISDGKKAVSKKGKIVVLK